MSKKKNTLCNLIIFDPMPLCFTKNSAKVEKYGRYNYKYTFQKRSTKRGFLNTDLSVGATNVNVREGDL